MLLPLVDRPGQAEGARPRRTGTPSDTTESTRCRQGFFGYWAARADCDRRRDLWSGAVSDDALTMLYAMEGARALAGARAGLEHAAARFNADPRGWPHRSSAAGKPCPDGNTVAYPVNSLVALHDVRTGAQHHLFGHTDRVHLTCFSRDGRVLVTGHGRRPPARLGDRRGAGEVADARGCARRVSNPSTCPRVDARWSPRGRQRAADDRGVGHRAGDARGVRA